MKWKFLGLSLIAAIQGGLLTWQEWRQWQDFEQLRTNIHQDAIICHISYSSAWPPLVVMILSFLVFCYSLSQFFRLNAAVPIQRRRLKIMPRRE